MSDVKGSEWEAAWSRLSDYNFLQLFVGSEGTAVDIDFSFIFASSFMFSSSFTTALKSGTDLSV